MCGNIKNKIFSVILIGSLLLTIATSCSLYKTVPIKTSTETIYNYIDTLIVRDSTVVIPKYVVKDVAAYYDTLFLETNLAKSISYVDTNSNTLKGQIENTVETITKIIYRDRIVYRDSIIVEKEEIPVYVTEEKEVTPAWCMKLLAFNIALLLYGLYYFFIKKYKIFGRFK